MATAACASMTTYVLPASWLQADQALRVVVQLIYARSDGIPESARTLDLANLSLGACVDVARMVVFDNLDRTVSIERLALCPRLRTLVVHSNMLRGLGKLDVCRELWNIDASRNQVRILMFVPDTACYSTVFRSVFKIDHLDGFERFMAFGVLDLSQNKIASFDELRKLEHVQMVNLILAGNPLYLDLNCANRPTLEFLS